MAAGGRGPTSKSRPTKASPAGASAPTRACPTPSPARCAISSAVLVGQDPRAYEARFIDMARNTRSSPGGIAARAMAGIECALVDIKARALGISVAELLRRADARPRAPLLVALRHDARAPPRIVGKPPIESWSDVTALGEGSGRARIHRAEDQHRHAGQGRHVVQRLRRLDGAERRMGAELADRAHREAHRDDPRRGRAGLRHQPRSQLSFQARSVHAHREGARAVQPALARDRQSRSGRASARSRIRPPRGSAPARR